MERPRARAAAIMLGDESTPVTMAPVATSCWVSAPSPQPTSRTCSPDWGFRSWTTAVASVATKRPWLA